MTAVTDCTLSRHAQHRSDQMNVTAAEVVDVLVSPELTYPSPHRHGPGRQISVVGRLAVVHHGDHVITVLWHRLEGRSANELPPRPDGTNVAASGLAAVA
jgi:hypothetical protein